MNRSFLLLIALLCCHGAFCQIYGIRSSASITAQLVDGSFECYGLDTGCVSINEYSTTICPAFGDWSYDSPNPPSICNMDAYSENIIGNGSTAGGYLLGDVFCSLTKVVHINTFVEGEEEEEEEEEDFNINQNLIAYISGPSGYSRELLFYVANFGGVEGYRGDFSVNLSITIGVDVFKVPVPAFDPEGVRWFPVMLTFCPSNLTSTIDMLKIEVEIENSDEKASCIIGIDGFNVSSSKDLPSCPPPVCPDCSSLDLIPNKKYIVSGWVKQTTTNYSEISNLTSYSNCSIEVVYQEENQGYIISTVNAVPEGEIIDGWQRMSAEFITPEAQTGDYPVTIDMIIRLKNNSSNYAFFDDIRIHPIDANLKSFVYDQQSQKLLAELDENNYATFYEYDKEGGLVRVKKETEKGIFTIQETRSSTKKTAP